MSQDFRDFYVGYEGEPELVFLSTTSDGAVTRLRMWIGHFDQIMQHVKPGPEGWTGLALPYHLETGWYEEDPWSLARPDEAAEQLSQVDAGELDAETADVLRGLVTLLQEATRMKSKVDVHYT